MLWNEIDVDTTRDTGYHSLMSKLIDSGLYDFDTISTILSNEVIDNDPSLFENIPKILSRINKAITNNEKIIIYGDYDCDGICATTILVKAFEMIGVKVAFYIPNRLEDGYGLNIEKVQAFHDKNYSLIITVDNGIRANEAIDLANSLGIDVIVTDHHALPEEVPHAWSILHTELSTYPFKPLSGACVAFKLATALIGRVDDYLYFLAALTVVSDVMPMIGENHQIVKNGLKIYKKHKYINISTLIGNAELNTTIIGFTIAPRINAVGRFPDKVNPNFMVKYLKTNNPQTDEEISFMNSFAFRCNELNSERQNIVNEVYERVERDIRHDLPAIVVIDDKMHEGIIGLIAGKLCNEYKKPAFVFTEDLEKGIFKGSARSIPSFPLDEVLPELSYWLVGYGGHKEAAGMSVNIPDIIELQNEIIAIADEILFEEEYVEELNVIKIEETDVTIAAVEEILKLEPFGNMFEQPIFALEDIKPNRIITLKDDKHLRIDFTCDKVDVSALFFNHGNMYNQLSRLSKFSIAGTIGINEYNGKRTINMILKDIKL